MRRSRLRTIALAIWVLPFAHSLSPASLAAEPQPRDSKPAAEIPQFDLANVSRSSPATLADLKSLEKRVKQIYDRVKPAIVQVSGGSGVIVDEDGLVMSVAHVGGRAGRALTFRFADGRTARGITLGNDRDGDAALMRITDKGPWPHVDIAKSEDVKLGQWCMAVSYPVTFADARRPELRIGRVLHVCPYDMVSDCTIMGGDSGGPLLDLDGHVIGISSRCNQNLRENVHVPTALFRANWDKLIASEDIGDAPSDPEKLAVLGVVPDPKSQDKVKVALVLAGMPAKAAGIQVDDVIIKVDGVAVKHFVDVQRQIRKHKPGDKISIVVHRGEEDIILPVKLAAAG